MAPPAPADGHGGARGPRAAATAQFCPGPADSDSTRGSRRAARGHGVGGVGLHEEAVQGRRGALRQAASLAGRVGLI